jgi:hypothetical protein
VNLAVDFYEVFLVYGWAQNASADFKEQLALSRAKSLSFGGLRNAVKAVRNYVRWSDRRGHGPAFAASFFLSCGSRSIYSTPAARAWTKWAQA